jgi:hypothetical protein
MGCGERGSVARRTMNCFAEPVIGRAFARPGGRNDGLIGITGTTRGSAIPKSWLGGRSQSRIEEALKRSPQQEAWEKKP